MRTFTLPLAVTMALLLAFSNAYAQTPQPEISGEVSDSCVADDASGHPIGKYCTIAVTALGPLSLGCLPDSTVPAGTCKTHYCDPSGSCSDTAGAIPSGISATLKSTYVNPITEVTSAPQAGSLQAFIGDTWDSFLGKFNSFFGIAPTPPSGAQNGTVQNLGIRG